MLQSIRALSTHNAHRCNHNQYRIQQWATFLTSVPKRHHYINQQQHQQSTTARRAYTSKTVHDKSIRKVRYAPRIAYQPTTPTTWIMSDGSVSADKEAIALAKGLQLPWTIKRVEWCRGLQWLPMPFKKLIMDYHHVVNRKQTDKLPWFLKGDSLSAPYPNYVIGSGAKAVPGILQVSRLSGKASFSAGLGLMKDQRNYFRVNSTLNTITPKTLESFKSKALERGLIPKSYFDNNRRPSPIVTVLIGGPNEDCSHNTERIVNRLARLIDVQNCRVLISFSQRTADNTRMEIARLQERIQDQDKIFVYDPMAYKYTNTDKDKGSVVEMANRNNNVGPTDVAGFSADQNPYEAMLALADKIVVTADSVAMTNEALATGKPVYILGGELARGKLKVFHRYLADIHLTRAFRPGRIPIVPISHQHDGKTSSSTLSTAISNSSNDAADPLSYPGDYPAWDSNNSIRNSLAGQGPEQARKLAERLQIMRECRLAGRRVPEHISNATS
ncbi:hypothetical protein BGX27_005144 [Mortierella sp. AM989]|nr:hypothetical protein BGX27_005144 [Mortierella sp. AM989]